MSFLVAIPILIAVATVAFFFGGRVGAAMATREVAKTLAAAQHPDVAALGRGMLELMRQHVPPPPTTKTVVKQDDMSTWG